MDKKVNKKQTAKTPVMTAKNTKPSEPVKAIEVIVEAPSKEVKEQAPVKTKKKRHNKPVKKTTAPAGPGAPAKKLNWFERTLKKIYKLL